MNHVFLIGFMGAGKSTVGVQLAKQMGLPFVDLDERIEAEQGRSISEIFESDGEPTFRALEREALETLSESSPTVVACGGGIVTVPETNARMRQLGTVVYLQTTADEALLRIGDVASRPLLDRPDAAEEAARLLDARTPLYEAASHVAIQTVGRTPEDIAKEVAALVTERSRSTRPVVVNVTLSAAPYEIVIGSGVLDDVGTLVRMVAPKVRNVAIVTDSTVVDLFGLTVESKLIEAGFDVHPLSVAAGEQSKSWMVAGEVLEALAELRLDRDCLVLALGGGVVGDLGGFVAATYLRGVRFVQVPTTLLAQVDSSVGGKTGVDLRAGKNLAGAFKQPLLVLADTSTLNLLPEREWASGCAEIAKSAIIDGEDFTAWLEANADALLGRDEVVVKEAVRRSVEFKSRVVSADETEAGPRECLNYGHTFGHALEKVAGFGTYSHGIAVAEGMRFAVRLAVEAGTADRELVSRQDALLDQLGLTAISEPYAPAELMNAMHSDKKAKAGAVRFVLPSAVGEWECRAVDEDMIREHVTAWAASKRGAL